MGLPDNEFLKQFEAKKLPPEEFTHTGHLRLAWLYINQYELDTAIDKITHGIDAHASSLGAPDKFHYTITEALVRIMQQWHIEFERNMPEAPQDFLQSLNIPEHEIKEIREWSRQGINRIVNDQ